MLIDAHQHFWALRRGDYDWLTPDLALLYRDFSPARLEPELRACGIHGTVLVQAAATVAETRYMLELADRTSFIRAVVGWIDFERDGVETIDDLAQHPRFRGVRPMLQDIADPDWILNPRFDSIFRKLIDLDLSFDALIRTEHMSAIAALAARHPELRIIIDHGGKPDIAGGAWQPWADRLAEIAQSTSAYCKVSGLLTEAGDPPDPLAVQRHIAEIVRLFGPDRIVWGSDWPVLNLAGSYRGWFDFCRGLGLPEQAFGANAARFYRLEPTA